MAHTAQRLLITPGFAAHEQDHNCLPPLQSLVRCFLNQNIDIQIVALDYPFTEKAYSWHGAPVFPCNGQNRRWLLARTLWRARNHCKRILANAAPPTLTIHSFWLGWAAQLGEIFHQKGSWPHITTLMGQDVLPPNQWQLRHLNSERCERLVAVSTFQNDVLERHSGLRAAHTIPWGYSTDFQSISKPKSTTLDILGVGNLIEIKNWEKWLRVIAALSPTLPNLRAELVGDGPERAKLEALSQQLGLEKTVHFAGQLPRKTVLERMQAARLLLHTADYESYGFVFAEAAVFGLPMVATPVGIAPETHAICAVEVSELAKKVHMALNGSEPSLLWQPPTMQYVAENYLKISAVRNRTKHLK